MSKIVNVTEAPLDAGHIEEIIKHSPKARVTMHDRDGAEVKIDYDGLGAFQTFERLIDLMKARHYQGAQVWVPRLTVTNWDYTIEWHYQTWLQSEEA
jgi:hypothetical protein